MSITRVMPWRPQIKEWEFECVVTITIDNAFSNDIALEYLKNKLRDDNVTPSLFAWDLIELKALGHSTQGYLH